jgi:hypothetical protein
LLDGLQIFDAFVNHLRVQAAHGSLGHLKTVA